MESKDLTAFVMKKEDKEKVDSGGVPVLYASDDEELEYLSMLMARLTDTMVHDLGNGIYILINH
ncbi:capping complex subunit for YIEGIA [Natroniella sp. ANB-PHB2]|uniref:capping complex subunit for YIEGIA n=1 Tax=Natroniella sp. ANB-PHB2 TaxID=3384444 RepID=UPI0038D3EC66